MPSHIPSKTAEGSRFPEAEASLVALLSDWHDVVFFPCETQTATGKAESALRGRRRCERDFVPELSLVSCVSYAKPQGDTRLL